MATYNPQEQDTSKSQSPENQSSQFPPVQLPKILKNQSTGTFPRSTYVERFGRYEIKGVIGNGGMGKVLLAYDPSLHRSVALKVLLLGPLEEASPLQIERFLREARATARLKHPNIVTIYDIGVEGRHPYFTMEYIEGNSLNEFFHSMSREKLLILFNKIVKAIAYAHSFNVIHRDLKPSNILIDRNHEVHILDFGLAKVVGEASLTQEGMIVGSPYYMSPEQVEGKCSELDQTTDIYSLGVILYEIATGVQPFRGSSITNIFMKILQEPVVPPSRQKKDIPVGLERIILKAMEKEKKNRYGTADEFAREIDMVIGDRHATSFSATTKRPNRISSSEKISTRGETKVLFKQAEYETPSNTCFPSNNGKKLESKKEEKMKMKGKTRKDWKRVGIAITICTVLGAVATFMNSLRDIFSLFKPKPQVESLCETKRSRNDEQDSQSKRIFQRALEMEEKGNTQSAYKIYVEAITFYPDTPSASAARQRLSFLKEELLLYAKNAKQIGQYQEVIRIYQTLEQDVQEKKTVFAMKELLKNELFQKASQEREQEHFEAAQFLYEQIIQYFPLEKENIASLQKSLLVLKKEKELKQQQNSFANKTDTQEQHPKTPGTQDNAMPADPLTVGENPRREVSKSVIPEQKIENNSPIYPKMRVQLKIKKCTFSGIPWGNTAVLKIEGKVSGIESGRIRLVFYQDNARLSQEIYFPISDSGFFKFEEKFFKDKVNIIALEVLDDKLNLIHCKKERVVFEKY